MTLNPFHAEEDVLDEKPWERMLTDGEVCRWFDSFIEDSGESGDAGDLLAGFVELVNKYGPRPGTTQESLLNFIAADIDTAWPATVQEVFFRCAVWLSSPAAIRLAVVEKHALEALLPKPSVGKQGKEKKGRL